MYKHCGASGPEMHFEQSGLGPVLLQKVLSEAGLVKEIYKSMESRDIGDVVMSWTRIIQKSGIVASKPRAALKKCDEKSRQFRVEGNQYLAATKYQAALISYNKALLFAPKNSREMVLAYSNRSALFFKFQIFSASLKDIEMCFSLGCPNDIIEKLLKRKHECSTQLWGEKLTEAMFSSQEADKYFLLNVKRNPQIPCATAAVGVVVEEGVPSVVAVSDIEVGTVVAIEKAFASIPSEGNFYYSCYYCNKMALNLFPCECCCFALYCSPACKDQSDKEYHRIESVLDIINDNFTDLHVILKASIKIKNACKSWEEFIQASKEINSANLANNTVKEMFDTNEKFSLLCVDSDRSYFNYGKLYNCGFLIATLMNAIDGRTSFFPTGSSKKEAAMKAFGRVMMKISLFVPNLKFVPASQNAEESTLSPHTFSNRGLFPFASKLKHDCNPNLLCVGLDNKIALVAIRPIRRGEDLTISYLLHWMQAKVDNRAKDLYFLNKVCHCPVCKEDWSSRNSGDLPTDAHKKIWKRMNYSKICESMNVPSEAEKYRKLIFETLGKLSDVPRSREYCQVFKLVIRYLMNYQHAMTKNIILSEPDEVCVNDL